MLGSALHVRVVVSPMVGGSGLDVRLDGAAGVELTGFSWSGNGEFTYIDLSE